MHSPPNVVACLLTPPPQMGIGVEESAGLDHQAVFPGRELLASHVSEGEAEHEGDQRVASVLLEGGHVFTQRVLVGA